MMTHQRLLTTFFIASMGCSEAPEDVLVRHIDKVAEMTTANVSKPGDHLVAMRTYVRKHLPQFTSAAVQLLMEIDTIQNPKDRAMRANEIIATVTSPVQRLVAAAGVFASMNKGNPAVTAYFNQMAASYAQMDELGVSGLDQIFGPSSGGLLGSFVPQEAPPVAVVQPEPELDTPGEPWVLESLIINLRVPEGTRYLKVAFEFETVSEKALNVAKRNKARVRSDIIEFLSDLTVDEVVGSQNKQFIKERLVSRLNHNLEGQAGGPVFRRVFFPEFIVQ